MPKRDNFLCCHCFRQLQNDSIFGLRFVFKMFVLLFFLLWKTIPSVLAWSELQKKFFFSQNIIFDSFNKPARKTVHFEVFSFSHELKLKMFYTGMSVLKEFSESSVTKFALSAKRIILISLFLYVIPLILSFWVISYDKSSIQIINKYGDNGQP